jgi:hypothetical protein
VTRKIGKRRVYKSSKVLKKLLSKKLKKIKKNKRKSRFGYKAYKNKALGVLIKKYGINSHEVNAAKSGNLVSKKE